MTDIGVFSQPYQSEDRSWLLSDFGDVYAEGGTLDITTLTAATHYPNGYLPSGFAIGKVTTGGLLGPYDDTASDGRQTCIGVTVQSVRILNPLGVALAKVGIAYTRYNAVISLARLPFNSTNAATGRGYIDANGQTDLKNILFLA